MRILETMLNWLYPRHCPICHKVLKNQKEDICPECVDKCMVIRQPKCMKCGKKLEIMEKEYCTDCKRRVHYFEEGIGIFEYTEVMKHSLMKYKYGGRREYVEFYARSCIQYGTKKVGIWEIQGIIPIPISRSRERKRGFNQSELLAERLGKAWQLPVYSDALKKVKKTENQKALGARERRRNLCDSFRGMDGIWGLDSVLLVDDVFTTGSTIDEAAKELKKHGVKRVYFLTIFMGKGF